MKSLRIRILKLEEVLRLQIFMEIMELSSLRLFEKPFVKNFTGIYVNPEESCPRMV